MRIHLHSVLRISVKILIVAAIAAVIIYRLTLAPIPVEAHRVQRGPIVREVMGTGTLEPRIAASVGAKISGRLIAVLADQNDRIKKEQLVAELDDGDLKQQVAVANAALAAAHAGVERAAADLARANAVLDQAKLDADRLESLRGSGAASAVEVDKSAEQYKIAMAELDRAAAARLEMERQAITAEHTLKYHQQRLADTRIYSPFDGLVLRRDRESGDVVVPGSGILRIASMDQIWVSAWVDESAVTELAAGQPARIVFRAAPDVSLPGKVTRRSPQTDPETREFLVDVALDRLPPNWAFGQRAEVYIETNRKEDAVIVPLRMLHAREGRSGVFVDEGGRARWREVRLGIRSGESVEIVSGLTPGERVVASRDAGDGRLREGRRVKPS